MPGDPKLIRGRLVITDPRRGGAGVLRNGAVAIAEGLIQAIGPAEKLQGPYRRWEQVGGDQHVVMPGLVNSHHHGYGLTSFQLGVPDDYLESWLVDVRSISHPVDPYWDTLYCITRLIRSGVTTVLHLSSPRAPWDLETHTRESLRAHDDAGMRVAFAIGLMDQNRFVYGDDDDFLASVPQDLAARVRAVLAELALPDDREAMDLALLLLGEHEGDALTRILLSPLGPQWCSDDLLRRARDIAASRGMGIHMHCLESPLQREYGRETYPAGTVARLRDAGVLGPRTSLAHGVWLTSEEIAICARTQTSICHNASSNLRLRVGIMPAAAMLDAGVNVAIGSDSMSLTEDEDFFGEMRLVHALHRLPINGTLSPAPHAAQVQAMATVAGGQATTFGAGVGTLEEGSPADVTLLSGDAELQRVIEAGADIYEALLRWGGPSKVDTVMIGGRIVLGGSRFIDLDEDRIVDEVATSARRDSTLEARTWSKLMQDLKPYITAFYRS